jgi:uncharacterized damage-inducible protein DinB
MNDIEFIVDQLKRSYEGEAWHGPSLMEALSGVDAKAAAARPLPQAHSIWQLVLHIANWNEVFLKRNNGQALQLSPEEDFPTVIGTNEKAWKAALDKLKSAHKAIETQVAKSDNAFLERRVPGKDYNFRFMLHGIVQHEAYHAGQISILKKPAK